MRRRSAFTLIELITVMAITAILLGIIIYPLIQSFNLTRAAEAFADAQDHGRLLMSQITRDIENSAGVRENDGMKGQVAAVVPGKDGTPVVKLLDYAKLDILKVAEGDPTQVANGAFINPYTGKADPTLHSPKGDVNLPVAPGMTILRHWIGLKSPLASDNLTAGTYGNPYDNLLEKRAGQADNLFVLYRAEVQPFILDSSSPTPKLKVNTDFFDVDANGKPILDDPYFFTQDPPGVTPIPTPAQRAAKAKRILNWLRVAQLETEASRYDMIQPVFDKASHDVTYDGNIPRVLGLIQFRPTPVSDESAVGMTAARLGEETDNSDRIAPDVFRTELGNWSSAVVREFPTDYDPTQPTTSPHVYGNLHGGSAGSAVFVTSPDGGGVQQELFDPTSMLFDVDLYENTGVASGAFPFSQALDSANAKSGFLADANLRNLFLPFYGDVQAGKVFSSFDIREVGDYNAPSPSPSTNFPTVNVPSPAYTPTDDPDTTGLFSDAKFQSPNELFNKVWVDNPNLQPNIDRFIYVPIVVQPDGTHSPLDPTPNAGNANLPYGLPHASVVPNSEVVMGPDEVPGPDYGNMVRYTRTTGTPGPNQYKFNYTDVPEPTNQVAGAYALDYPDAFGYPNPPAAYTPTDFTSAILQPRFKAGYIKFDSDPNAPIPPGNITVTYRFQFNRPKETDFTVGAAAPVNTLGDTFTVDYDTRQVLSVLLTIRNYPQTSLPNPQTVTLKSEAQVRNFLR